MDEKEMTLEDFRAELATMDSLDRGRFEIAKGAIQEIVKRFPGVGLMAVAYVCAEEAAKMPDPPGAQP